MNCTISPKSKYLLITFLLTFFVVKPALNAQDYQPAIEFIKQFKNVQDQLPRESIYLHTDRDWYYSGERIWFSAYSVAGGYTLPSELSSVLYVELIDPDGAVVRREIIELEKGRGEGSIATDTDAAKKGDYLLRAYTKWAMNFGESYAFTKNIRVLTPDGAQKENRPDYDIDVQFLPESGHLVAGIPTKLAFKAIGTDGLGKAVKGTIYNSDGQTIKEFSTEHLGMGVIDFTPESNERYYAEVNGLEFELPKVQPSGVVLNITRKGDFFELKVKTTGDRMENPFLVFAHVRGVVYHAAPIEVHKPGNPGTLIPKNKFASGIVHFTLLNGTGSAIAERLAYANNPVDQPRLSIDLNKDKYALRDRVQLSLQLSDYDGNQVVGTASIAIFDDKLQPFQPFNTNIQTHLWFETELKGHIEDPGFYFSDHEKADEYLDLLLLTQGWRAFEMQQEALKEKLENLAPPELGVSISGQVSTLIRKKPLKNAAVYLSVGSDNEQIQIITTDENGRFTASDLVIQGEEVVNIKANREKGGDRLWIDLDDQFKDFPDHRNPVIQIPYKTSEDKFELEDFSPQSLQERSISAIQNSEILSDAQMRGDLGEFTVTGQAVSDNYTEQYFQQGSLSGSGTQVNMDDAQYFRDLPVEQVINQLPGVEVNSLTNSIRIRNTFTSINSGSPPPLILIDGIEYDAATLFSMRTMDIQSITVARSSLDLALYGSRGAGGAIVVTTRKGGGVVKQERGFKSDLVQGYQSPIKFYAPKYGVDISKDIERLDNRITLHWEPELILTENMKRIEFWTSDISSRYRIIIEGITENGNPFHFTKTFSASDELGLNTQE